MTGDRGMIVAGHHVAAEAGAQMLREGGNAMDAAIAAAASLAIAVPYMNGLGGDAISLWCDANGAVETINGSGRLPGAFDAGALAAEGLSALPATGPLTVSVPGVVAAWGEALDRYGTRALGDVLDPAIEAAETGVPDDATNTAFYNGPVYADLCRAHTGLAAMFGAPGTGRLGRVRPQPGAAETLGRLARDGWRAFYDGPLAEGWLARAQDQGVLLSADDLAAHRTDFQPPLSVAWRGMTLQAAPPPIRRVSRSRPSPGWSRISPTPSRGTAPTPCSTRSTTSRRNAPPSPHATAGARTPRGCVCPTIFCSPRACAA